jgi:hypothetical protein
LDRSESSVPSPHHLSIGDGSVLTEFKFSEAPIKRQCCSF